MRRFWLDLLLAGLTTASIPTAVALPPSSQAPEFKATDSNGKQHDLAQYRGKWVVLEWANRGCPYDQKHYLSGNMEALQREWTAKGVVWLSVLSSGPGQQGYVTPAEENDYLKQMNAAPTAALLDPQGAIGHLYDARTTPHIFVIDPAGKLVFRAQSTIGPRPIRKRSRVPTIT